MARRLFFILIGDYCSRVMDTTLPLHTRAAAINQHNRLRRRHKFIDAKIDASMSRVFVMPTC